jgi:membrane protein required for beta-lactamase induction
MTTEDRVIIKTLLELKESVGRLDVKVDTLTQTAREHDRADQQWHEAIDDKLDEYNQQLILHISRTEQLEEEIKKLEPVRKLNDWVTLTLKVLAVIVAVASFLKLISSI